MFLLIAVLFIGGAYSLRNKKVNFPVLNTRVYKRSIKVNRK